MDLEPNFLTSQCCENPEVEPHFLGLVLGPPECKYFWRDQSIEGSAASIVGFGSIGPEAQASVMLCFLGTTSDQKVHQKMRYEDTLCQSNQSPATGEQNREFAICPTS